MLRWEPEEGIVFSEAVEMAQAMLDSMDIDAAILGGETLLMVWVMERL